MSRSLKPLFDFEVGRTITDCALEIVDEARQLLTEAGQRHYRVFLVWIAWTVDENLDGFLDFDELDLDRLEPDPDIVDSEIGTRVILGEVGVGRPRLIRDLELLPTPRVTGSPSKRMDSMGLTETGGVTVDQISMRLPEDLLMGLVCPFRDPKRPDALKDGIEFFWEIREHRPPGYVAPGFEGCDDPNELRPPRRRYHVQGTPERQPGPFQWSVSLTRADGERGREGEVDPIDGDTHGHEDFVDATDLDRVPDFRFENRTVDPLLVEEDDED